MNALSRREEDTLLKTTKARALSECDPVVKGPHAFYLRSGEDTDCLRICRLRDGSHFVCCVGLQRQVQGFAGMYATVVSLFYFTFHF